MQKVATTPITTSGTRSIMQLATWGGSGMYYVQIINPQGIVVDDKKIILQQHKLGIIWKANSILK